MSHVVSGRPLTAEARIPARGTPCGICGVQSGTGAGSSPISSVLPRQYRLQVDLDTLIKQMVD
jgi:hypothetical protein